MTIESDIELYRAWCDGDKSAGAQLIDAHFSTVYRFFANKCGNELEDLVQLTFMRVVEKLAVFQEQSSFRTFLLGVAQNVFFEHCRRKARQAKREVDVRVSSVHALDESPSQVVARESEARFILESLRHLPIQLQVIMELYYWEDMSTDELAKTLSIPLGTVKSRLFRGRELLKEILASFGADPAIDVDQSAAALRRMVTP